MSDIKIKKKPKMNKIEMIPVDNFNGNNSSNKIERIFPLQKFPNNELKPIDFGTLFDFDDLLKLKDTILEIIVKNNDRNKFYENQYNNLSNLM